MGKRENPKDRDIGKKEFRGEKGKKGRFWGGGGMLTGAEVNMVLRHEKLVMQGA